MKSILLSTRPKWVAIYKKNTDKKLKALEIIIKKSIEVSLLKICEDVMAYNNEVKELYWLTREEFEIVKSIITQLIKEK